MHPINAEQCMEIGAKVILATDRIFLFIQPEQMASMHLCLASCAWWHKRCLFSQCVEPCLSGPRTDAWLYLRAHNYVRLWGWKCAQALRVMDGGGGRTLQGAQLIQKSLGGMQWRWGVLGGGGLTLSTPSLQSSTSFIHTFTSTSPIPLFICPLSTCLPDTPITVLTSSPFLFISGNTKVEVGVF